MTGGTGAAASCAFVPWDRAAASALVAPASPFSRADFDAGLARARAARLVPVYDERVFARDTIVAGPATLRAAMLQEYLTRGDLDAVLAVRGGYGSAETLPLLDPAAIRASRTAFIGYWI